ncbi:hypothetical protein [Lysobacter gummosus]|uniref:hypothetical protein n=1 Tax=Lysobacter gummosus TaxID=262324 RepID=UPI0036339584
MQSILEKAQAAANEKQAKVFVFRAVGPNGDELGWFNFNGQKKSPNDELIKIIEPDSSR